VGWSWTTQAGKREFIEVESESPHAVKVEVKKMGLKMADVIVIVRNPPRKLKTGACLQQVAADPCQERDCEDGG